MTGRINRVLVIGGTGRIGQCVTHDLLAYTTANISITGRNQLRGKQVAQKLGSRVQFQSLDLADHQQLKQQIAVVDLVIHCAGPFLQRQGSVLKTCIAQKVNYLDISDHRSFTIKALAHRDAARTAGVTAVVNSGIFPGISNSMVRRDVETLDRADQIHLSYVVNGSGGAGMTVMKTTFLGLQQDFLIWKQGQWQTVAPYSDRERVEFPQPFGWSSVYWFDMPEAYTLPQAFPSVHTVVTKFGSLPHVYNQITGAIAHKLPKPWLSHPTILDFLVWGSFTTTQLTDHFSGIGVAIRSQVIGEKAGQPTICSSTLALPNTAISAGFGTGSIAQLLLAGKLNRPGVWSVEEILPTLLFEKVMTQRQVNIEQKLLAIDPASSK